MSEVEAWALQSFDVAGIMRLRSCHALELLRSEIGIRSFD